MSSSRRSWLRQAILTIPALQLGTDLFASPGFAPVSGPILMNSNENPYGPSPMARQAMAKALAWSNRYPDDKVVDLKKDIADHWGVGKEHIAMGAGASELIGLCNLHAASLGKGHVITPETAYKVWWDQAQAQGLEMRPIANNANKDIDLNAMLAAINDQTRVMYLCNPNNPTGKVLPLGKVRDFVLAASKKTMVLLDEAYTEYAGFPTMAKEATTNMNLVVLKTFSKIYGLAGARLGYAIAHPDMIRRLGSLQPWPDVSVSQVTAAAAVSSLKDQAFVSDCRKKNAQARDLCYKTFAELGFEAIPSETNFILFNIDKISTDLSSAMEKHGIAVQYRNHFGGKWCRVSMGTVEETTKFCSALHSIVEKGS
jgi:histidinol-phosphate aminotransferase